MLTRLDASLWRSGFLVLEDVTRVHDRGWIDSDVAFVDVLNDPFFIDHESGAVSEALLFVEYSVSLDYGAFEVAEDRKGNFNLFGEFAVGGNAVDTHAEDLRVVGFEFGDISLIRLQFLRSTTCESQNIKGKYNVLLSFEVA